MTAFLGYHAVVDGIAEPPRAARWTKAEAWRFCRAAVKLAGMTLISGPHVALDGPRILALAILAESHVSVHLDTDSGSAHADLFSCRNFDSQAFTDLCIERLGLRWHQASSLRRDAKDI